MTNPSDWLISTIVTLAIVGGTVAFIGNKYMQKKAKKAAKKAESAKKHDNTLAGTTLAHMSPSATSPKAKK